MPNLTLLHTSGAHCATFDALAAKAELAHIVRPDLLERAQTGIDSRLYNDISCIVTAAATPVLCTCTTIGEAAEAAGAVRIDWPMMQEAARLGSPLLMAYCLHSTLGPSQALLNRAFAPIIPKLDLLDLSALWPLFEAGESAAFGCAIAEQVALAMNTKPFRSVVLAQASMAGAAQYLADTTDVPVLSSPLLAIRACLKN